MFSGVFSSDTLPIAKIKKRPCYLVVNLDPSYMEGSHWVSLFLTNNHCFYFDSYGRSPSLPSIKKFIRKNSSSWSFSKKKLQSLMSDTCGHFCCMLGLFLNNKRSVQDFLDTFTHNTLLNDILVCKLFASKCSAVKNGQFCKSLLD